MRQLIVIEPPTPLNNLMANLFVQIAARFGCTECKYKKGATDGGIYCPKACNPCKLPEIQEHYDHHRQRILNRTIDEYTEDLLIYAMHPSVQELPFKELP